MTVKIFPELEQGSDEWFAARCGLLTASEMKFIVAPPPAVETRIKKDGEPYKQREWDPVALNDKERSHLFELLAQRITKYVEPHYVGDDQLRGYEDEVEVRRIYAERYAPVTEVGFITNDRWGFTLGYSPDGLVGQHGQLEAKSRRQKYQIQTIIENVVGATIPADFMIQVQTGLLVSERQWCDFVSYCGGLHAPVIRAFPDPVVQDAIVAAAGAFEERMKTRLQEYQDALVAEGTRLIPTERKVEEEMVI